MKFRKYGNRLIALMAGFFFYTSSALSVDQPTLRFVNSQGIDEGVCASPQSPCRSINYAINQSVKGDQIRVAEGLYPIISRDLLVLIDGTITLRGGYSNDFTSYQPSIYHSRLTGVSLNYKQAVTSIGFGFLPGIKGVAIHQSNDDRLLSKNSSQTEGPSACDGGMAASYECHNIDLQSHIPLNEFSTNPGNANDIWGFVDLNNQKEYAIVGLTNGTAVIDVSDPTAPVEVGSVSGITSIWRDVKVYQYFDTAAARYKAFAYVTTEANSQGMQILDLTDLSNGVTLASTINEFSSAHNVYISNIDVTNGTALEGFTPYLYIIASNKDAGAFRIFDLNDPVNPSLIAVEPNNILEGHDATSLTITDSRTSACVNGNNPCQVFVHFNGGAIDLWDVTDPTTPTRLSSTSYSGSGFIHSGWPSSDGMTIFVQDETDEINRGLNTTMRALDISDLANPQISATYTGQTAAIDHNGFTIDNYYYMSNYQRGLAVIDVTDTSEMKDVAFFDTYPGQNSAEFNGAWGVYPFLPSGNIVISDIEGGLFVLKLNENDGAFPTGGSTTTPPPAVTPTRSSGGGSLGLFAILLLGLAGRIKRKGK